MAVDPVLWLFPELQHVSATSLWFKLTVISASFVFFLILFILCYISSHFLVKLFTERLHPKEKFCWCTSVVSILFGIYCIFNGVWFLIVEDALQNNLVSGCTFTSHVFLYVAVGFFLFDTIALVASGIHYHFFNTAVFVHHVMTLYCIVAASVHEKVHFIICMGLFLELTAPFSYLSWMLRKCGMAHLWIWKANHLVLVHLFHCRTTIECYVYYKILCQWENYWQNVPPSLAVSIFLEINLLLLYLTPYWTYEKTAQLFKPMCTKVTKGNITDNSSAQTQSAVVHGYVTENYITVDNRPDTCIPAGSVVHQEKSQKLEGSSRKRHIL